MQISVANLEYAADNLTFQYWGAPVFDAGNGWKHLGSGCSRSAYLGPDKLVYKVSAGPNCFQSRNEYRRSMEWRKTAPEGIYIPKYYFHEPTKIIVGEYLRNASAKYKICDRYIICGYNRKCPNYKQIPSTLNWARERHGHCACDFETCWTSLYGVANEISRDVKWENIRVLNVGGQPKIALVDLGIGIEDVSDDLGFSESSW